MNVSAPITEREIKIHYGMSFSRQDHVNGARSRKRGDDAPSAGGLAPRTFNVLQEYALSSLGSVRPVSRRGSAISRRTVMNNVGL
jgi:hypothetical protein